MKMHPLIPALALTFGAAAPAFAQMPAPAGPAAPAAKSAAAPFEMPALRVAVTQVSENRSSSGSGNLTLNLSILGEGLPPTAVVRQVKVTKAVDDKDRPIPLTSMSSGFSPSMMMSSLSSGRGGTGPLQVSANLLGAPLRSAESLKFVEGTIEFYLPSEANGSMLHLPNIMVHTGLVEEPTLTKHGIQLYFYKDQASYDELKTQVPISGNVPVFPLAVGWYLRDPSNRVASFAFLEANGAVIRQDSVSTNGSPVGRSWVVRLLAPMPNDAQLIVYLAVPEAIKTVPFRVEEIMLP